MDGEVSPYLVDELAVGDPVELRGPIGGYFVRRGEQPLPLVGGGSGHLMAAGDAAEQIKIERYGDAA